MSLELHNTENPLSNAERLKINENWQRIISGYGHLQQQIKVLAGGTEVGELIQKIQDALDNSETTLVDLQAALNDATQLIDAMTAATTDATNAAGAANQATSTAVDIIADLTLLQTDLEQLQATLTQNITNATQATTNANTAANSANQATTNAQQAATNAVNAASRANDAADAIEGWTSAVKWVPDTYNRNNIVTHGGNTYQAKKDGVTSTPPTNPAVDTADWVVLALKGIDGQGAVQTVNGQSPGQDGNVNVGIANINGLQDSLNSKASNANLTLLDDKVTAHLDENNPHAELVAKTLYVSVNAGNDTTGDGTSDKPYKTITKALSTLQKVIVEGVKIRVLPGDYTAEGAIIIQGFKGIGYSTSQGITITAFDGTNDILSHSDNYVVNNFHVFDNELVQMHGFKSSPATADYGIFITNCRFVGVKGYKITKAGNSAIGVTGNSFTWVSDSVAQSQNTVLSVNQGSNALSQNWINSTGNSQGLVANAGSEIKLYDNSQPLAVVPYLSMNGGNIYDSDGVNVKKPQIINASRDLSIDGTQTIATNFKASSMNVRAFVTGTKKRSDGSWAQNGQACVYVNGTSGNVYDGGYWAIVIEDDTGINTIGTIVNITNNSFDINWTKGGTGATGIVNLQFEVQYG